MALNWLEEIAKESFRLDGYLVLENEHYRVKGRRGDFEIDAVAFNEKEIAIVESQADLWSPTPNKREALARLKRKFDMHADHVKSLPLVGGLHLRKVLVGETISPTFKKDIEALGVEVVPSEDLLDRIIKKVKAGGLPKQDSFVTRTIASLASAELLA